MKWVQFCDFKRVRKVTIFETDIDDFNKVGAIMSVDNLKIFGKRPSSPVALLASNDVMVVIKFERLIAGILK